MSRPPAEVFLIRASAEESDKSLSRKTATLIDRLGFGEDLGAETFVALKIHFGEKGNKGHIRPGWLKESVARLRRRGSKLFLTDTNTLYMGRRSNAPDHLMLAWGHGFNQATLGIPVVISDGLIGEESMDVPFDGLHVKTARIGAAFRHVDRLLCLSHFTGHVLTGFGAALKNLGMGCASRAGKLEQHAVVHPWIDTRSCRLCRSCFAVCPAHAVVEREGRAAILDERCIGCGECLVACKFGAVQHRWDGDKQRIQEKMAEYACAVHSLFPEGAAFINFLIKITKECDCMSRDDPSVTADVGLVGSLDPVAADRASLDLINRAAGRDLFREIQGSNGDAQLIHAERVGLGTNEYRLTEIEGP